jgi:hypothetical protein
MNAPEMLVRLRTPQADGLALRLRTLTPLYTGGIGQLGDQVHPSNLLGGIRHLSCLLARTLGDSDFEAAVWGNPGRGEQKAQARQVALRWDTSRLERKVLPPEIKIPRGDGGKDSRWWFNTGFEGELSLQLTRRGISDNHWHFLTLALAIQLRHGSFGAKDQFGLGVLAPDENSALCHPLDVAAEWPKAVPVEAGKLNLLRYAFGRLRFRIAPGQRPSLNHAIALKLALATRATLRNALRARPDASEAEKLRLTALRHQMLGKLNQAGSAVNVSAAYRTADGLELRLAVALKPAAASDRNEVRKAFSEAAGQVDSLIEDTGYRVDGQKISLDYGQAHAEKIPAWLNQLAGV